MTDHIIRDLAALEALYGAVNEVSALKEITYLHPHYAAFVKASPFAVLATAGPHGLDASPRGDPPGFIEIVDDKTLLLADRRGNNRIDSLRNILADPHVALLFLDPRHRRNAARQRHRRDHRSTPSCSPASPSTASRRARVLVVHIESVFFQCSRALIRSELWNPDTPSAALGAALDRRDPRRCDP